MALGDLVASTGCVVSPYLQFPQLMGILLYLLGEGGDPAVRRAVIRTLGIIGALDPYSHRQNEMVLQVRLGGGGEYMLVIRRFVYAVRGWRPVA